MDRIQMDSKLEKLTQLLNAVHSQKPIVSQAKDFHLSASELFQQTQNILSKYEHSWPHSLTMEYRNRIEYYKTVLSALQSIINNSQQSQEINKAINEATLLYESVLEEYTITYSTYNNASIEERKRITEEIFLPHYMLISFLNGINKK